MTDIVKTWCIAIVILGSCARAADAQNATGLVVVHVLDSAGGRVPRAVVGLRCEPDRRIERTTDAQGVATFESVAPSACDIAATANGFAAAMVALQVVAERQVIELTLAPAAVGESVTVEGSAGITASIARMPVPLIETPQSIQVLPREILEAQQVLRTADAARNVSNVTRAIGFNTSGDKYTIRGFLVDYTLKNGFKNNSLLTLTDVANVERVEVLKGPASMTYGRVEPGGVVNVVTKRPGTSWTANGEIVFDRFGLTRPAVDVTGPLTADRSVLFRLNGAYERTRSHRDGIEGNISFVAPSLTWQMDRKTIWSFEGEYLDARGVPDSGLPLDPISLALPLNRNVGEPGYDSFENRNIRNTIVMNRELAPGWLLTAGVSTLNIDAAIDKVGAESLGAISGTTLQRGSVSRTNEHSDSYFPRIDLTGRFRLARLTHSVLAGVDGGWEGYKVRRALASGVPPIDLDNPRYGVPLPAAFGPEARRIRDVDSAGIYVQDQMSLTSRWRLLVGGRFDAIWLRSEDTTIAAGGSAPPTAGGPGATPRGGPGSGGLPPGGGPDTDIEVGAGTPVQTSSPRELTPRLGLVYYIRPTVSLYASFARSFNPPVLNLGTTNFDPTRGRQWEGGLKFDAFDSRLEGSTAIFHLEKDGQTVGGVGEGVTVVAPSTNQRSRGAELDIRARPTPGIDVLAACAFVSGRRMVGDVRRVGDSVFMSRDNLRPEELINSPARSGNVWVTFRPARSVLRQWTFGLGAQYVGERRINIIGDFVLPAYTRVDAMSAFNASDRVKLQVNLKNLTNRRYYETDGHFGLLLPASPVNIEMSLRVGL